MCATICDMNHHFVWNLGHGCGHHVDGAYGTNDAAPLEGTLAVLDTGGFEIRNDREVLPDLIRQAVLIDLLTEDRAGRLISATFIATPPYSDDIIHSSFHYNIWLYGKIINFHSLEKTQNLIFLYFIDDIIGTSLTDNISRLLQNLKISSDCCS